MYLTKQQIRETLNKAEVPFREEWCMANQFHGTRFTFQKRDLKKVDKTILKDRIQANFKEWCVEIY